MEYFYLIVVVLLGILAFSDLIVGVSNDAVNFLNSAIGSKALPIKIILIIASLGVLVGATFSSGLMEIARKGIFHPEAFAFQDVMIIFLAVMVTDILLLDLFNTYGLPTSTTVSIVFELLGAAFTVAIFKIYANPSEGLADLSKYINSDKALAIITGILISVFIAFFTGLIIQYISRMIFSFNYKKTFRYFGSLWGAFGISLITYFIVIKGAKGTSFIDQETVNWITQNTVKILLVSLVGWTVILQLLRWLFRLDILKMIVLVGTFALALSFAGNDLVNFIGVPLAGLSSYQSYVAQGHDSSILMTVLAQPVKANTLYLLLAGVVMSVTLWTSRKARSVTKTEVNLGRQAEGYERFGATGLSRGIVRMVMGVSTTATKILPKKLIERIESRFDTQNVDLEEREQRSRNDDYEPPAFDMIRASVNLVVSSALIALGTSLKLPLSTTYVTFMVAMGSSLSDRAWGRESAVFRVTGVFTVIGGWFLTALTAFLVSGVFAAILMITGWVGILLLMIFAIVMLIRTRVTFKRRESTMAKTDGFLDGDQPITRKETLDKSAEEIKKTIKLVPGILDQVFKALHEESIRKLRKINHEIDEYYDETKKLKESVPVLVDKLSEENMEAGHYYIQIVDYLKQISNSVLHIGKPTFEHVNNQHKSTNEDQINDLKSLQSELKAYLNKIDESITKNHPDGIHDITKMQNDLLSFIDKLKKRQIKRIKNSESGTKVSMLYLNSLEEIKNIVLLSHHMVKSHMDFVTYMQNLKQI